MKQLIYNPPVGSPPFEWQYSSQNFVVQPPDQPWKKVEEEYEIGPLLHPKLGTKMTEQNNHLKRIRNGVKYGIRQKWVVDEEAKSRGVTPHNTLWVTPQCYRSAKKARNAPLNEYITEMTAAQAQERKFMAEIEQETARKLQAAQKAQDKVLQEAALERERQKAELKREYNADMKKFAEELGVDLAELQAMVAERKKGSQKRAT
jgi:hypothetical protein